MNVYLYELKSLRNSIAIWVLSLSAITIIFLVLYPAFSDDVTAMKDMLAQFPPQIRNMFGLDLEVFFSFLGFYAYILTYITLAGAVQAMSVGISVLAKEPMTKTTEFLLTKPVTRHYIVVSKLAAGLTALVVTVSVFTLFTYGIAKAMSVGSFDIGQYVMLNGAFMLLQVWSMALGMLISQLVRKVRSVVALSISTVFGLFFVGLLGALLDDEKLRYLSPFKYFDYMRLLSEGSYEAVFVLLAIASALVMGAVSYVLYMRRDARGLV
ncbi:ABC transporter permease [Candidatus Saccharibacteria bacterium]|nr:ABC transporter permease [Candidatus Saccharibacteria bacterium]